MLEIIIDWVQFTTKERDPFKVIISLLHLNVKDFTELTKGKLGYKKQLHYNNIFILYDGTEYSEELKTKEMGTHIIITGQGCRYYETKECLVSLINRINQNEAKLTRIDLAIDDKPGETILLNEIIKDVKEANTVSKWKNSLELTQRDLLSGQINGQTLNLGSRSSDVYLRIYNKSMEREEEGNWVRMEIEIKGKKAQELQKIVNSQNVGQITKKLIHNYFRVVEPGKDTNKSRWKIKEYWKNIIKTTEKLALTTRPEEPTLESMKNWVQNQVSATIATIVMAEGGCMDFLYDQISIGSGKLKTKHNDIIKRELDK